MSKSHISPTYKAIMLDVDGTTVNSTEHALPSPRVTEAIKKAQKHGIQVSLATGRPYSFALDIINHLGLKGPSVLSDGAEIVYVSSGKTLFQRQFDHESLKLVIDLLKRSHIQFVVNDNNRDIKYTPSYIPDKPMNVFTWGMPEKKANNIMEKLSHINLIAYHKFGHWEGGTGILISHALATKQHGILELAKILNISTHEIIGVGDGYNDFPMMMACGLRVAMGNAVPELKEIADYVAPSVYEDGVATVIEKYILNKPFQELR